MESLENELENKFVDLTSWDVIFYYITYCVVTPSNKEGVAGRASNAILPISKCSNDQEAIGKFNTFNEQEEYICKSIGKTFISGTLFKIEHGKISEIKVN